MPEAVETLDQISRRLVIESGLKLYGKRRQALEAGDWYCCARCNHLMKLPSRF